MSLSTVPFPISTRRRFRRLLLTIAAFPQFILHHPSPAYRLSESNLKMKTLLIFACFIACTLAESGETTLTNDYAFVAGGPNLTHMPHTYAYLTHTPDNATVAGSPEPAPARPLIYCYYCVPTADNDYCNDAKEIESTEIECVHGRCLVLGAHLSAEKRKFHSECLCHIA